MNSRPIGHDTNRGIRIRPIPEYRRNRLPLLDGNVQCFRMCVQRRVLEADISDCGGIYKWHECADIID